MLSGGVRLWGTWERFRTGGPRLPPGVDSFLGGTWRRSKEGLKYRLGISANIVYHFLVFLKHLWLPEEHRPVLDPGVGLAWL